MPEHETVPMARGYRIVKDQRTGNYYALYGNQTSKPSNHDRLLVEQRIKIKSQQLQKP